MASIVQSFFHRGHKDHGVSTQGKSRKGREEPLKWAGQESARPPAHPTQDSSSTNLRGRTHQNHPQAPATKVPSPYTAPAPNRPTNGNGIVHFQSDDVTVLEEADKVRLIFASRQVYMKSMKVLRTQQLIASKPNSSECFLVAAPGKPVQKEDPTKVWNINHFTFSGDPGKPKSYGPIVPIDLDNPFGVRDYRTSSSDEDEHPVVDLSSYVDKGQEGKTYDPASVTSYVFPSKHEVKVMIPKSSNRDDAIRALVDEKKMFELLPGGGLRLKSAPHLPVHVIIEE